MIAQPGAEPESADAAPSASDRAHAMRARLGAQRDAEELLAEASELRRAAAEDADTIVADAEVVAEQLVAEARETADKLTTDAQQSAEKLTTEAQETAEKLVTEAQERADGIFARARLEADDLQRHTEEERARIRDEVVAIGRAEIEEFRTRSAGLIGGAEDGLRDLAPSLEAAANTVAEVLRAIEELRGAGETVKPGALELVGRRPADDPATTAPDATEVEKAGDTMVAEGAPPPHVDDPDARPLGWLFRAPQS